MSIVCTALCRATSLTHIRNAYPQTVALRSFNVQAAYGYPFPLSQTCFPVSSVFSLHFPVYVCLGLLLDFCNLCLVRHSSLLPHSLTTPVAHGFSHCPCTPPRSTSPFPTILPFPILCHMLAIYASFLSLGCIVQLLRRSRQIYASLQATKRTVFDR